MGTRLALFLHLWAVAVTKEGERAAVALPRKWNVGLDRERHRQDVPVGAVVVNLNALSQFGVRRGLHALGAQSHSAQCSISHVSLRIFVRLVSPRWWNACSALRTVCSVQRRSWAIV